MPRSRRLSFVLVALVAAACAPSPAAPSGAPETVAVTLDDDMTIELDRTEFAVGETVRFEVTNAGAVRHELYLGDMAAQDHHADEMAETDGMGHDEPNGVSVEPGTTETLSYTFAAAGEILAGCHEPGHYEAGMVTSLTVRP